MKTCPNCEAEIQEDKAVYCPKCGLNLEEDLVIEEEGEGAKREKRSRVMRKLAGEDEQELLARGIPKEKIAIIKEDLRLEFLEGNLKELPVLLKDCVFQKYSRKLGSENPKKGILCGLLREERRCVKEICPLYQGGKS